ncbi:MAG: hypothetical protein QOF05_853 [Sphingomonadales bacterium]|jgi:uncharacterized protein (DUF2147 family)|nr:hypothetical protein [Sphingomonadales bacterium]
MKRHLTAAALALALAASPAAAQGVGIEGHWTNPKHSTLVHVTRCDANSYCAIVLKASAKAQANARKGGTKNFIGTEILRVSPAGDNLFRGKAFDPESNMHVPATVRFVGSATIEIQGCALFGLICKTQRWTKVD